MHLYFKFKVMILDVYIEDRLTSASFGLTEKPFQLINRKICT